MASFRVLCCKKGAVLLGRFTKAPDFRELPKQNRLRPKDVNCRAPCYEVWFSSASSSAWSLFSLFCAFQEASARVRYGIYTLGAPVRRPCVGLGGRDFVQILRV